MTFDLRPRNFKHLAAKRLLTQYLFTTHKVIHLYNTKGHKQSINTLLVGSDNDIWNKILSNRLGRLVRGTKYGIYFQKQSSSSTDETHLQTKKLHMLHLSVVTNPSEPNQKEYNWWLVVKMDYNEYTGTPTVSLLETKLIINSVISDTK